MNSKYKRIFIVGHMGAGKALVGETLAKKIGWQFLDADFGLEHRIGRSVNEILGKQGEESLRQCESEILSQLLDKTNVIVVTDGGVISTDKNRKLLSSEFVVYLQVSTPVQIERMEKFKSPFTLISQLTVFKDLFEKLHRERDGLYQEVAKLTINTDSGELEKDVNEIIKALEK